MWELTFGSTGKSITVMESTGPKVDNESGGLWYTFDDDSTHFKHWGSWAQIESFGVDDDAKWHFEL